jgi:phosphate-selective porin OprO/OprP
MADVVRAAHRLTAITHCILLLGQAMVAVAQPAGGAAPLTVDATQPGTPARAGEAKAPQVSEANGKPPSVYDRIWRFTELYRNDANPVLQRLRFSGRYQHDYATIDADQGGLSEWNVRRMRLGLRAEMFRRLTVHGEVDLNPQEADPLYVRLTDMYIAWAARPDLTVTVGKQSFPFTLDGATSSKELLALDRNALTNNIWFTEEYLAGVTVSGSTAPWVYTVGVYSAGAENREFGEFSGGVTTLSSIAYDFAGRAGARRALLTADYVYQDPDPDNSFTQPFQHIVSLNLAFETGRWGVRSDLSAASGYYDQSDIWGVMAMPFLNVTDRLQLVGRYTYLDSRAPNGIRFGTYENRVVQGRGDRYHELYAGANYYFYGHRLKLQSGIQLADMSDRAADGGAYSGASWTTGVRVGW